jgi:beta-galactosidase GanA
MASTRDVLEGAGVVVKYAHVTDSTYVLSGKRPDGTITYQWYAVGAGSVNGIIWSYPAEMKNELHAAVTSSVNRFITGDLTVPH